MSPPAVSSGFPIRAAPGLAALAAATTLLAWRLAPAGSPEAAAFFTEALVRAPTAGLLRGFWAHGSIWLHGDATHLAGNLVGLLLLGGLVERRQGPRRAASVVLAGAVAGVWVHLLDGQTTLGISGGVYALAGALATGAGDQARPWGRPRATAVAASGWAWLGLGALGGLGLPQVDHWAHGAGALVGVALGWAWAVAPGVATLLPLLLMAMTLGPLGRALTGGSQAGPRTHAAAPLLRALPDLKDLVVQSVAWHAERRAAVDSVLSAARRDQPLEGPSAALRAGLSVASSPELAALVPKAEAALPSLEGVPHGAEYRARIEGLLPAPPPARFAAGGPSSGEPFTVDESSKGDWEALFAFLKARDRAITEAADALQAWRLRL